jgi:hypothetical protein
MIAREAITARNEREKGSDDALKNLSIPDEFNV